VYSEPLVFDIVSIVSYSRERATMDGVKVILVKGFVGNICSYFILRTSYFTALLRCGVCADAFLRLFCSSTADIQKIDDGQVLSKGAQLQ
jgi:hypothetical protein